MELKNNLPEDPLLHHEVQDGTHTSDQSYFKVKKSFLLILGIIIIVLFSGLYLYKSPFFQSKSTMQVTPSVAPSTQPTSGVEKDKTAPILQGTVKLVTQDLGLVTGEFPSDDLNAVYYEAGVFSSGIYKGYKRIIVIFTYGPSQASLIFATSDDKSYVVDGTQKVADQLDLAKTKKDTQIEYPYGTVNRAKVKKVDTLLSLATETIVLNDKFALHRHGLFTITRDTGKKDSKYNNPIYETVLFTDVSSLHSLTSVNSSLKFYAVGTADRTPFAQQSNSALEMYTDGSTKVIVVDPTGLAYAYDLTTPERSRAYAGELDAYNSLIATPANLSMPYEYPKYPNLRFTGGEVTTNKPLYVLYDIAFPGGCSNEPNTSVLKDVPDSALVKIGMLRGQDAFTLKDKNHILNHESYDNKIKSYINYETKVFDSEEFKQINGVDKPTFEEYIAKNPLIIIKDYWGRWVALGEFYYRLPGGCGKPVVYLYPEKPTEVTVSLETPITFDTTIPTYTGTWRIMAHPDGVLTDLQPNLTDCKKLSNTFGSEYAKDACLKNQYPYLYWSGQAEGKAYPVTHEGWIVSKTNLPSFMDTKLNEIGFNKKEKDDMLSYWVPEMKAKNARYYKISFLQTVEMNYLIPMQISPRPDSIYRLFLDWKPLMEKPAIDLEPQSLSKVSRHGFTVVEWGGLRQ